MRTQEQRLNYQRLELVALPASPSSQFSSVLQLLQRVWDGLLAALHLRGEICIYQRQDSNGQPYWLIHRAGGRSVYCASEQEVRTWLEQYSKGV